MINEKQENIVVNTLPNGWEKEAYTLYLQSKLQESQNDIRNGKVMTIEESKERLRRKYKSFNIK